MLNFYDFEVFKYDWLVVIINPVTGEYTEIVNDPILLNAYYQEHKEQIWVGYNSNNYDQYILKGIQLGFDPKRVNDLLILEERKGWEISSEFNKIQLYNYDVMTTMHGLKKLEAFQGHNIHETGVSFDIDRKLTAEEIAETLKYCKNDVEETITVFNARYSEFEAHMSLINTFKLPLSGISKSKSRLSATILECDRKTFNDEWDIQIVDTIRIEKYREVVEWFLNPANHSYDKELQIDICGVPHVFAWGGIHGAKNKIHRKGLLLHIDVDSFYPAIMIEYDLLSRAVRDKNKYRQIRDTRIQYKKEKNPLQQPYKIVLNSTYGICKDKYSPAYDPRQANNVCINGQLILLDLLEHLEAVESLELIQSNTDGIIVMINEEDFDLVDDICYEWEQRTRMGVSFDYIKEIWQKDVNNYVFIEEDGAVERKGAYVKNLHPLDNDLPIINEALVNYMLKGVPVEETILNCTELIKFQKIVSVSSIYSHIELEPYGRVDGKCHRLFATKNRTDGIPYKVRKDNGQRAKVGGSSEHTTIIDGCILGMDIPEYLDKQWYINLAKKRLEDFGIIT